VWNTLTDRPSEDVNTMDIAHVVARRSTCRRLKVGAVLVRDSRVLSTGRNGAPSGEVHCQSTEAAPCTDCCHAEANSLVFAARHGVSTLGASMYCTIAPCKACSGLLINAGVVQVVYDQPYRLDDGLRRLEAAGIVVRRLG
jgi:dCMP deaminase